MRVTAEEVGVSISISVVTLGGFILGSTFQTAYDAAYDPSRDVAVECVDFYEAKPVGYAQHPFGWQVVYECEPTAWNESPSGARWRAA